MKLGPDHLLFLLKLNNIAEEYKKISAIKKGYAMDLISLGLLETDEEGFLIVGESGYDAIDIIVQVFNTKVNP